MLEIVCEAIGRLALANGAVNLKSRQIHSKSLELMYSYNFNSFSHSVMEINLKLLHVKTRLDVFGHEVETSKVSTKVLLKKKL